MMVDEGRSLSRPYFKSMVCAHSFLLSTLQSESLILYLFPFRKIILLRTLRISFLMHRGIANTRKKTLGEEQFSTLGSFVFTTVRSTWSWIFLIIRETPAKPLSLPKDEQKNPKDRRKTGVGGEALVRDPPWR